MEKTENKKHVTEKAHPVISVEDLARLGGGQVAYVKQVNGEQVRNLFPTLTGLPEGIDLYAVVGADGTPLGLTDSRDSAIASVLENNMEPVSVH